MIHYFLKYPLDSLPFPIIFIRLSCRISKLSLAISLCGVWTNVIGLAASSWEIGTSAPLSELALTLQIISSMICYFSPLPGLNIVQICPFHLSLQDVSSACLSKSWSVKLAPFRIPLVANPVIRQPIWLRSSEVFCFSFLDYIIPHGEEEVNGFFVVFLPIFFLYCGYFLVTTSHNFPQSLK